MKAAELREKLVGASKRARSGILHPAQRKYSIAKGLTATFTGDPDGSILLDTFYEASDERMLTLTEIVAHANAWKLGVIDEMVPSGAWAAVRARATQLAPTGLWAVMNKIAANAGVPAPAPAPTPLPVGPDEWERLAAADGPLSLTEIEFIRGWLRGWADDASTIPISRKALHRLLTALEDL